MKCEHILRDLPTVYGTIIVTNFKVVLKMNQIQPNLHVPSVLEKLAQTRVQDYFRIPLGMIQSVENYHNKVEIVAKDQRRLCIIMVSIEEANVFKEMIKHVTFLNNLTPADRQMNSFFAVQMYEHIINKMALATQLKKPNIVAESSLSKSINLLKLNNRKWNFYSQQPLNEFKRQGCVFASET